MGHRYNDPIQIPGAFYAGDGPKGPLALPGDYQVKMTAAGKTQTAPLHLAIDPRTKGQEGALQKTIHVVNASERSHFAAAPGRERNSRSEIADQESASRFGQDERLKPALTAADDLDKKMSDVEQQLCR